MATYDFTRESDDDAQTTFAAEFHPDQQTLDDVEADADDHDGTCVCEREWCPGISGMFLGDFPCANCWLFAPAAAHYYYSLGQDDGAQEVPADGR